jgi:hypothetical protein
MFISILDLLEAQVFHFMKTRKRVDKFNAIWLSMHTEHNLTRKNKSSQGVSQSTGTEMKEMSL